jgi:peptide/nickel transport system ATP-binding protein
MSAHAIELKGVRKTFRVKGGLTGKDRHVVAVDDISFAVPAGGVMGVVGESGCGKSTLARLILGLLPPDSGEITVEGQRVLAMDRKARARLIQPVFQDPFSSLNPLARIRDIVAMPLIAQATFSRAEIAKKVDEMLARVGLSAEQGTRLPAELSGGQRQRVAIARALVLHPRIVVCDEPTSALDVSVQAQILNLMRDLQDKFGLTYLFISHNLAVVRHMANRIGVMYLGRIVEIAEGRELFSNPRMPYTKMLLGAVPDLAMSGRQRIPVKGEIPNPIDPPPGCAFNPRCPLVFDLCRREAPALIDGVACHAVNNPAAVPVPA